MVLFMLRNLTCHMEQPNVYLAPPAFSYERGYFLMVFSSFETVFRHFSYDYQSKNITSDGPQIVFRTILATIHSGHSDNICRAF